MNKYAAAVEKAALGWLVIKTYSIGTVEQIEEDCQTVATTLAEGLGEPAAAVYRDIQKTYFDMKKPQVLQLLTLMENSGTLNR